MCKTDLRKVIHEVVERWLVSHPSSLTEWIAVGLVDFCLCGEEPAMIFTNHQDTTAFCELELMELRTRGHSFS